MSTVFCRTTYTLSTDDFRFSLWGVLFVVVLLGVWGTWAIFNSVPLYAVTNVARLEVDRAVHPVEAPVDGRVVATHLNLGQEVQVHDVLVELETAVQQLQRNEERTRLDAITRQLGALREELAIVQQTLAEARSAARVALDEARAKLREATVMAQFTAGEAARSQRMHTRGLLAERDLLRAQAEAQQREAASDGLQLAIDRLQREQQKQEHERQVELVRLTRAIAELDGQRTMAEATIARLTHEVVRRHILAPVSGRLGEIANVHVGGFVKSGDRIAAVVPASALKVVAEFLPAEVLGRIRPGQPARVRLDSFPWAQYGIIVAEVATVASETSNGRIRVELTPSLNQVSLIPLQHGLPGMVEVEVERVAPAALVLRAAGKLLTAPRAGQSSAQAQQEAP